MSVHRSRGSIALLAGMLILIGVGMAQPGEMNASADAVST